MNYEEYDNIMKKLILFDIDSTLITMNRTAQRAIMDFACEYALGYRVPLEVIPPLAGKTDLQIISEIFDNLQLPKNNRDIITENFMKGLQLATPEHSSSETISALVGAKELVTFLYQNSDITLGLLTGNNRDCAYFKLKPTGLDQYFSFGAFGCDHHDRRKLPPIAIQRANILVGKSHFTNTNTLIIGDAPGDVACAKANNIPILAVASGQFSPQELSNEGADEILNNFTDVQNSAIIIYNLLGL